MTDARFRWVAAVAVAALVLVAGGPSLRNGFLNYDDPQMILDNPRLADPGPRDVVLAFSELREYAYLPLYTIALMPDAAFFGRDPAGFHLGSLLWHAIGAVLVLLFVHALARSRTVALVAASVFAVHPLAAESVAWASGRKDQVSFALLMLALSAALGHLRRGGAARIALSCLAGALAMLAKGSAVVYPLLAFLIVLFVGADGTRSSRARPAALLAASTLCAAAGAMLHLLVARSEGVLNPSFLGASERFLVFLVAVRGYFLHLAWPVGLSIHYDVTAGDPLAIAAGGVCVAFGVASITFLLWRARPGATSRLVAFAAGWALLSLLPFNGVFPATSVAMADRYAFDALPAAGIAAGALVAMLGIWPRIGVVVALTAALIPLARARYAEFRDAECVFRAALAVDPGDSLAPLKLAEELRDRRPATAHRPEAIALMRAAAARAPDPVREARARLLLADTLLRDSRFVECIEESDRVLAIAREHGEALARLGFEAGVVRYNRAAALLGAGRRSEAVVALVGILRDDPSHRSARLLHAALEAQGALVALGMATDDVTRDREREKVNRSVTVYERELALLAQGRASAETADQEIQACSDLVRLLQRADWRPDHLNAALMHAEALIRRHPGRAEGFIVRAQIMQTVDSGAALADLRAAAALEPRSVTVLRAIAGGFLAVGKNREAILALERARSLDPGDPGPGDDLCAIYVAAAKSHMEGAGGAPDLARAREALRIAQAIPGVHPEALELDATCLEKEDRHDEAHAVWETLLAADPASTKARLGVARFLQRRGLSILANVKRVTETRPVEHRGAAREELLARVSADFKAAVAVAPPDAEDLDLARGWLKNQVRTQSIAPILAGARVAAENGDLDGAARLLEQAAGLNPTYVEVAELEGHVAMQRRDDPAALRAFERTLALDPDNLAANDALARLHLKRGEPDKALARARKFLALAATMRDETTTLREEVELMQRLVRSLAESRPESRPESRR